MRHVPGIALTCLLLALALPRAADAYEFTVPADGAERGTVVLVHGGAWLTENGAGFAGDMRPTARMFARRGLRAVVAAYRTRAAGIDDVVATLERERARRGDDRLCVYGESAGGHWALLAAGRLPWLRCAIAVVAPLDLVGATLRDPAGDLARLTRRAFGVLETPFLSPTQFAEDVRARTLLVNQRDDTLIPTWHAEEAHAALRRGTLVTVEPGPVAWMHGTATTAGIRAVRKRIAAFAHAHVQPPRAGAARARSKPRR